MTDAMQMGQQSAHVVTPADALPDIVVPAVTLPAPSDPSLPQRSPQTAPAPHAGGCTEADKHARLPAPDERLPYEPVENAMADVFDFLLRQPSN